MPLKSEGRMDSLPPVALYQPFINKFFNKPKFTNKPTQEMTIYEGSVYMLVQISCMIAWWGNLAVSETFFAEKRKGLQHVSMLGLGLAIQERD